MTDCRTCQSTIGLLTEIAAAVRALPPEKQVEFRREVMARNLTDTPGLN
jgi:hypothetical protein